MTRSVPLAIEKTDNIEFYIVLLWFHFIHNLLSFETFHSPGSFSCRVCWAIFTTLPRFFVLFEVLLILSDQRFPFSMNFPREYKCRQTIYCTFCWEPFANKWHFASCMSRLFVNCSRSTGGFKLQSFSELKIIHAIQQWIVPLLMWY